MDVSLIELAHKDFRKFLREELIRRCDKNGGYSLRAFARQLSVNHATLSSILSGNRKLTENSIIKLSRALKLSDEQVSQFVQSQTNPMTEHQNLTLDTFTAIAEWHHDAILELTHVQNFKPDIKWISTKLGITSNKCRTAIERLQRLELLDIQDTRWKDCSRNNTTNITNDLSSAALRRLQLKILELSQEALTKLPRTQRDHTSLVIAMQTSDLAEVKKRIKDFRYELVNYIERKKAKPDAVFQFAFSVFPLTKDKTKRSPNEN